MLDILDKLVKKTKGQKDKRTKGQKDKGTSTQRNKGENGQRDKSFEMQKGTKGKSWTEGRQAEVRL